MSDLAEFVRARLDEDEAAARAAALQEESSAWEYHGGETLYVRGLNSPIAHGSFGGDLIAVGEHIVRHDPARVLRQVEATRRILALHEGDHECSVYDHNGDVDGCAWVVGGGCSTTRLLSTAWSDHPDYRQEWKP